MFEHEVGVWFGLNHPHVVRLFGACHVGTPLFACEYANNGSLEKYLRKHPNEMWQKLHEAALGVQYLHSRNIVHCDLKCNNIVVGGDNKAKLCWGLTLGDTGVFGQRPSELSTASDIYALGMCIVEALQIVEITTTNKQCCEPLPWGNLDNNVVKYRVARLKVLPSRPNVCKDNGLVKRMCAYDSKERIKISTVVDKLAVLARVRSPAVNETE
ncbi:Serine/threonine protein kinase [Phytophthora megakarya]|uniref:Serine/threonine protein kinase n=1 Tax=Phytophthora megakarya TaxID=4795 RepID=A0A225UYV7_9STRA|nr:Serine/threonine protein kinase [Phytophthora megakarya]